MSLERARQQQKERIRQRQSADAQSLVASIRAGDRSALSSAITLVESSLPEHISQARDIMELCMPHTGQSVRIGITGVPGVGKSTFIEAIGNHILQQGHRIAVLAIDPSSERTRGSILGDKTRMETFAAQPNVFVRPSPSSGTLGGVAHATRESILLCEAAGFDVILVETVGVGQSEVLVHSMVDFFLLLLLAHAGDELQGIKRGIMEMADGIVIHKADRAALTACKQAQREFRNALHLFPPSPSGWSPFVQLVSSLEETGLEDVWQKLSDYQRHTKEIGWFERQRQSQAKHWMHEQIRAELQSLFYETPDLKEALQNHEQAVEAQRESPVTAARALMEQFKNRWKS